MIITKNFHNKITGLIILFLLSIYGYAQDIQYGLNFKSYEVEKERRTSLNLSPEKPLSLPSDYMLSFDLKLNSYGKDPFGYIFRIFNEDGKNINLLLNIVKNTNVNKLVFTYSAEELFGVAINDVGMKFDEWYTITVHVDARQNVLKIKLGEKEFTKVIPELGGFNKINVIFGRNNRIGSQITDIPSMAIRNIRIHDERRQKLLYEWLLKTYSEEGVYDEINHRLATVDNPDWISDQHVFWKKKTSFITAQYTQIAYNPIRSEIGIYNHPSFFFYDIQADKLRIDTVNGIVPWGSQSNNMISDQMGNYIYYTFNLEKTTDALIFRPEIKAWNKPVENHFPPDYWHHNRLIANHDGKLYLFGGYGFHRYKNDVHVYDFSAETWEKTQLKGNFPYPHYLSGLGVLDDKHILIFGGYGSETGNQSLAPRFFYNLYKVNMETLESEKLWTLDNPEKDFVISNSLVVDPATNSFYALTYSLREFHTKLTLLKFSIDKPGYEVLGDSIPVNFEDTKSYVDLFLNKETNQLVAIVSSPIALHHAQNAVSIYTLAYPPLAKFDLVQKHAAGTTSKQVIGSIFIVCVVLGIGLIYYRIRKRKRGVSGKNKEISHSDNLPQDTFGTGVPRQLPENTLRSSSVILFGGFCVIDKDGQDVTKEFTPMLKQLYLLILLYTCKDRKGISSTKLKDILWYDKSDESAKNNRGVSIRKLRQIFELVGDIWIRSNNSYWTVEFGENVYCDYAAALSLVDELSQGEELRVDHLKELLAILSRGELLPNLQVEWVDSFKSDFSNNLMDVLLDLSKKQKVTDDSQLCLDLADAIFIQDSLNEDALRLKCTMLVKMGRNKLSKKVYEAFVKEYYTLFGTNFEYSFEQIIHNN